MGDPCNGDLAKPLNFGSGLSHRSVHEGYSSPQRREDAQPERGDQVQGLLGIAAGAALIAGSVLLNAAFPLDKKLHNWVAVAVLGWSQIVIASILLSELRAIGLPGFLICHLAVLVPALALWIMRGRPSLAALYFPSRGQIAGFIQANLLLTSFFAALALILSILVLPTSFVESDAAHYHIPRAHYWIQNRTARHFYTDDVRQIERPPNSSFLYMWQILVTGGYAGLNIPQWMAGVATAMAVAALARSAGHPRSASLFASAVFLSLPGVVLQMSTPWNDLLTAFSTLAFVHFALEGVVHLRFHPGNSSSRYLAYAGIAFGLMIGTKYNSMVLLPSLALVFAVRLARGTRQNFRTLTRLSLFCAAGFLVLGAYNYLLNVVEFGSPIPPLPPPRVEFPAPIVRKVNRTLGPQNAARSLLGEIFRYVYQTMDWILVKPIPGADTLYVMNNSAYRVADELLDLHLEARAPFDLKEFGMRSVGSGEVGFGPLGYAMALTSPLVLALMLVLLRRGSEYSTTAALLVLALGSFVVVAYTRPWTPAQVRYLTPAFALLVAALVPHTYSRRALALVWLLPIGFLALWSAYWTADESQRFEEDGRTLAAWQLNILESGLPPNAKVGAVGSVEFVHMLEQFRGYRFEPVPEAEMLAELRTGGLDAVLILDTQDLYHEYRLPLEHDQSLLVRDPKSTLVANLDNYGASIELIDGLPVLHLRNSGLIRRLGPDLVQIFVPTTGPLELAAPLTIEVLFPVQVPSENGLWLVCEGSLVDIAVRGRLLSGEIPASLVDRSQPTQLCRLHIQDLEFGQRIPSSTIQLSVRVAAP